MRPGVGQRARERFTAQRRLWWRNSAFDFVRRRLLPRDTRFRFRFFHGSIKAVRVAPEKPIRVKGTIGIYRWATRADAMAHSPCGRVGTLVLFGI